MDDDEQQRRQIRAMRFQSDLPVILCFRCCPCNEMGNEFRACVEQKAQASGGGEFVFTKKKKKGKKPSKPSTLTALSSQPSLFRATNSGQPAPVVVRTLAKTTSVPPSPTTTTATASPVAPKPGVKKRVLPSITGKPLKGTCQELEKS
jgi:hypothetical protein